MAASVHRSERVIELGDETRSTTSGKQAMGKSCLLNRPTIIDNL